VAGNTIRLARRRGAACHGVRTGKPERAFEPSNLLTSQTLTWADAGKTLNDIGRLADDAGEAIHANRIRGNHARFAHDSNICRKNVTEDAGRLRYSVSGAHMQANENSQPEGR
jgi:hypothetical protein